jgi:imidazolonepropionase-like amidohydrolase
MKLLRRSIWPAALLASLWTNAVLADVTVVRAARVLADASKPGLGPTSIVVRDGKIVELLPGNTARPTRLAPNEKVTELELGDRMVLPGLIDSHVHLQEDRAEQEWWQVATVTDTYRVARALHHARLTVMAGFTTVRDLRSRPGVSFAVRDAIRDGIAVGPRVLAAGTAISITGGHGTESGFSPPVTEALDQGNTCAGPWECVERVRELSRDGADLIKVMVTGGVNSQQGRGLEQQFSNAELEAIVQAANMLGLKVACHAHGARAVEASAHYGCASVEHAVFADDAGLREMKAKATYLVPTLSTTTLYEERLGTGFYTPAVEEKIKQRMEVVGKSTIAARKLGVKIALGTDAGFYKMGRNGHELALLVKYAGMTPRDALIAATLGAAELLGLSAEIGTLEPGKTADLIAVDGDPLADVSVVERLRFVMARGAVVRNDPPSP